MIGYYIHHHGRGHLHRAIAIARALGEPVTGLSSLDRQEEWPGEWLTLERDDLAEEHRDATAGGMLHWVPLHDVGLAARMASISEWLARAHPRLVVVDVSVEVALLCRLHGVPVVTVAMPGDRSDHAHSLGYAVSSAIIGAWPDWAIGMVKGEVPVVPVGGISRFAGRAPAASTDARRVLVMLGAGGDSLDARLLESARRATPDWEWTVIGGSAGEWVDDPWPLLSSATVVVTHAGQNAIADVAAARRPAIVIPQDRPHDEQVTTAAALAGGDWPVVVCERFPSGGWAELLSAAARLNGEAWAGWTDGGGAERAAEIIRSVG